jgi:hypothetical protein
MSDRKLPSADGSFQRQTGSFRAPMGVPTSDRELLPSASGSFQCQTGSFRASMEASNVRPEASKRQWKLPLSDRELPSADASFQCQTGSFQAPMRAFNVRPEASKRRRKLLTSDRELPSADASFQCQTGSFQAPTEASNVRPGASERRWELPMSDRKLPNADGSFQRQTGSFRAPMGASNVRPEASKRRRKLPARLFPRSRLCLLEGVSKGGQQPRQGRQELARTVRSGAARLPRPRAPVGATGWFGVNPVAPIGALDRIDPSTRTSRSGLIPDAPAGLTFETLSYTRSNQQKSLLPLSDTSRTWCPQTSPSLAQRLASSARFCHGVDVNQEEA